MKSVIGRIFLSGFLFIIILQTANAQKAGDPGYVLEFESEIAQVDSLHFGDGIAIGYSFFNDIEDFNYVFRKRVLKPGAEIRYHLQENDEIYYILSGSGEMKMNDMSFEVSGGTGILTRSGSSHGLKQTGEQDLVLLIVYEKH